MRKNSASYFAQLSLTVVATCAFSWAAPAQAQHTSGVSQFSGDNSLFSVRRPSRGTNKNAISNGKGLGQKICRSSQSELNELLQDSNGDTQKIADAFAQHISNVHTGGPPARSPTDDSFYKVANVHTGGPPARVPAEDSVYKTSNVYTGGPPAISNVHTGGPPALLSEKVINTSAGELVTYVYSTREGVKIEIEKLRSRTTVKIGGAEIVLKANQIVECS